MGLKKNINVYRKIINDFGLNIIASIILTFITALIINPFFAYQYSAEDYGLILTLAGIVATITATFGNTLNNLRLIENDHKELFVHNYNVIIFISGFLGSIILFLLSIFVFETSLIISILLALHTMLSVLLAYYIVAFRLKIDYVKIFFSACITAIFYFLGLISIQYIDLWPIVYLFGDIGGLAYIFYYSDLLKEPFRISNKTIDLLKKYGVLISATLISNILVYLDRFFLYPLIGGEAVSTYTTAAFFGKSLGLVMGPIASVLLSYFANWDGVISKKYFWIINLANIVIAVLFMISSVLLAPIITRFFFPNIYELAEPYLFVGNLAAVIGVLAVMSNPVILRFCNIRWQMIISLTYGIFYISTGLLLSKLYGLWGFAIAAIISNISRLLLIYIVGHLFLNQAEVRL